MNEVPLPREEEGGSGEGFPGSLARRIMLSEATHLARRGDYSGAEALIAELPGEPDAPALDLSARIRAQQGRYSEAESLWLSATQIEPHNAAYRAALDRLARARSRPPWRGRVLIFSVALVAAAFLVFQAFRIAADLSAIRQAVEASPGVQERPGPPGSDPASRPVAEVRPAPESSEPSAEHREILSSVRSAVETPGISVHQESDALLLRFEEGLFGEGTAMTPWGVGILSTLGAALHGMGEPLRLEVVGHGDDLPLRSGSRYRDNASLSLYRAATAAERLRAVSGVPAGLFQLRAGEEHLAPFPNDSPENRLRNRTVTLRITVSDPGPSRD